MFEVMANTFGSNFVQTDKVMPENFFDTMFQSMTLNIEDSRLALQSLVLSSRRSVIPILEPVGEDFIEIKASYQALTA
jgi:hypothetical protein